ncbi:TlpA family protein disulfide reductase [Fodinibius salsisoli]|uniref:TlpA family protein disulfide reductase n=1 Tax=Fodinibius salsisoli TaxID=2820877 RepID=A0ABT3PIW9_9BACT|nr:TlpA disulfide reductase family protein [Fodinibius salsisoli]MCW9705872.1 TlpA family protein disulfide reductase [Fodinibius salsisoli]
MVKESILKILFGILSSVGIMAAGFYFFLFANPIHLHQANLLKWIPILICFLALFISGKINKETPVGYLPLLFIPFVIFDLFNFLYFPFIIVLTITGIVALLISRDEISKNLKVVSAISVVGIFIYYLLAQPLIIEQQGFGRNVDGELVNATVLWNPSEEGLQPLPTHILVDDDNNKFQLQNIAGKTHFIAFWATWCGPCLEEKPQLDSLKQAYQGDIEFIDISIDEDKDKWRSFIDKYNPAGLQLITNNVDKTRRDLNISSLPLHFIVNQKGEYHSFTSLDKAMKVLSQTIE